MALLLITISAAVFCYVRNFKQVHPWTIVTKKTISVYAGPGRDYAPLATAQACLTDENIN